MSFLAAVLAAACILLLSFLLFGNKSRPVVGTKQANLQWLEMRKRELLADDPNLSQEAALRLLEEGLKELPDNEAKSGLPKMRVVVFATLVACTVGFFVYDDIGAYDDLRISERLQAINDGSPDTDVRALVADIEERLEQRPNNRAYLGLLGSYYMGQAAYPKASQIYEHMAELMPDAPQILAYAAQARYLSRNRQLDDRSKLWAEQAISLNPRQTTALGLLGMAAFESGDYQTAIKHWRLLRALNGAGTPEAQVLDDLLAQAREASGELPPVENIAAASSSLVLKLDFSVTPRNTTGTVFVVVRPEGMERGMPLAVKRLSVSDLPATVTLSDADSMAGQKLSTQTAVAVSAHLSLSGSASSAGAPYKAETQLSVPVGDETPISVRLAPTQ